MMTPVEQPRTETTTVTPTTPAVTPSQTVGPFFLPCLLRDDVPGNILVQPQTAGERIRLEGRVLDGDGNGVPDALVEIWQANAAGRFNHPADARSDVPLDSTFLGYGRSGSAEDGIDGRYWFETIKPGPVPLLAAGSGGQALERQAWQAPHISLTIFARGLLNHLATRLYFADEAANAHDPVLRYVPAERRHTLLARREAREDGRVVYTFDIHLQGADETVFFNL